MYPTAPCSDVDSSIAAESLGLGEETRIQNLAGGRDERIDLGQCRAAGDLPSGNIDGAVNNECRRSIQRLGKMAHHRYGVCRRVDLGCRWSQPLGRRSLTSRPEGIDHARVGDDCRIADRNPQVRHRCEMMPSAVLSTVGR